MVTLSQQKPMFSFYGDDFTGSADALEALASNGVPAVLFLRPPEPDDLRAFSHCLAIGIAGDSRSRPPDWMRATLPAVFGRLREIGAPIVQYKVCSTFDSSPEIGSIGCALEIGQDVFGAPYVPVVPAAPYLQRYVAFGNLFAAGEGAIHRIDRHPTMQRHPVTPMVESDLLLHLGRQTSRRLALVNILALRANMFAFATSAAGVLFDGVEPSDLEQAARLVWEHRHAPQSFVVGSSGFTHGILEYWRAQGWLPEGGFCPSAQPADRVLVLSGSCSPVTGRQICRALRAGFHGIRLNPLMTGNQGYDASVESEALEQLGAGRSVILYSALGPEDDVAVADRPAFAAATGRMLRRLIQSSGVGRVAIVGGDTASQAVQELGIQALTFRAPIAPGAPLCRAHGGPHELDLVLKGGHVGSERFFDDVLQ
ncbi:MAG TPA: four-carbon acid sugar kinase family protein [Candidatus Acidoferrales bacterium]|nr:four-carbon acid sugar kinase family protein [Candidatus Acidoferrales bacterium]